MRSNDATERDIQKRTGKCQADVVIKHYNLSNGTGILELQDGFLFDAKDNHIITPNTDLPDRQ